MPCADAQWRQRQLVCDDYSVAQLSIPGTTRESEYSMTLGRLGPSTGMRPSLRAEGIVNAIIPRRWLRWLALMS